MSSAKAAVIALTQSFLVLLVCILSLLLFQCSFVHFLFEEFLSEACIVWEDVALITVLNYLLCGYRGRNRWELFQMVFNEFSHPRS